MRGSMRALCPLLLLAAAACEPLVPPAGATGSETVELLEIQCLVEGAGLRLYALAEPVSLQDRDALAGVVGAVIPTRDGVRCTLRLVPTPIPLREEACRPQLNRAPSGP